MEGGCINARLQKCKFAEMQVCTNASLQNSILAGKTQTHSKPLTKLLAVKKLYDEAPVKPLDFFQKSLC